MKKIVLIIITIMLLHVSASPSADEIGEITMMKGAAEYSSFISGIRYPIDEGNKIKMGHKIKTGNDTDIEIYLKDGTMILIKEETSLYFYSLRMNEIDPPTKLRIDYGKIRIIQKRRFIDKTLELITPTAIISVVMADFALIASENETLVMVYGGRAGLENVNSEIRQAFVGTANEEISVYRDRAPSQPVIIPSLGSGKWLENYSVVDKYRRIIRNSKDREIIDWILRRREY